MPETQPPTESVAEEARKDQSDKDETGTAEYGGPKGREPTRYGDWEKNGRCIDF